jgi:CheY-like chemotaxis protein
MSFISDADPDSSPTVLIVDNNQMAMMRMSEIFRHRQFHVIECSDGDQAVDEYIRNDPELVVMSLDIPSLDGHLAALEMREHGGDSRILFTAPRRQRQLAIDAAHSAGAVAWVEKPVTNSMIDAIWEDVIGPVPEAPGLADLDQLYPDKILIEKIEEDDGLPAPFPLPLPFPLPGDVAGGGATAKKSRKKGRKILGLLFLVLIALGLVTAEYMMYIDIVNFS